MAIPAHAADILILVRAQEAGPLLHEGMYREPTWVLWPKADDPAQFNRILSLPSGVDWQSDAIEREFDGRPSRDMTRLWARLGYFDAVRENLRGKSALAIRPDKRIIDPYVLTAAWSHGEQRDIGESGIWPNRALLVAMASGSNPWDEVAKFVQKAGGRALVVEVPDDSGSSWSRFWLRGKGWPEGVPKSHPTGLPGLVEAKALMSILVDPDRVAWKEPLRDPPNDWLDFGHRTAPVALVFLAVAGVYVLGMAVFMALREQNSRLALFLLRLLVIGPAAIILGGRVTSITAIANWPASLLASFAVLFLVALVLNRITKKWITDSHLLWGEFVIGLMVVSGIDPTWSMFSSLLGPNRAPISPEAFGALASYAIGANYLFSNGQLARVVWGLIAISASLDLLVGSQWATPLYVGAVPLTLAVCYRPIVSRLVVWLSAMTVVGVVGAFWLPGLVYAPDHLVHSYSQVGKFNCAEQVAFLLSPMFIGFAVVGLVVAIAGGNFLGHQIRRAMAFSPKSKPFFSAAIGFGLAGVFIPLYLHAMLATAIAGAVAVLFDAVRVP